MPAGVGGPDLEGHHAPCGGDAEPPPIADHDGGFEDAPELGIGDDEEDHDLEAMETIEERPGGDVLQILEDADADRLAECVSCTGKPAGTLSSVEVDHKKTIS